MSFYDLGFSCGTRGVKGRSPVIMIGFFYALIHEVAPLTRGRRLATRSASNKRDSALLTVARQLRPIRSLT
jgi:hypothetical protein